jgi:hypothetical protein
MSDIIELLNLVIKQMVSVETILKLTGDEKKDLVLNMLKKNMSNYEKYEEIIPIIIELVVLLSRQKIPINIKNISSCCNLI